MYNKAKRVVYFRTALIPLLLIFFLAGIQADIFAGTTGKISGRITDSETGEPLLGANVVIEGTYLGAAADNDGYYYINNIPPGEYRIIASAVGYQRVIVEKVLIKIDLTTKVDVKLSSTVISMGEEVVVTATRPLVQKDLTSTSSTITSSDIKMMPVEEIGQVINLQAGVIGGHFRGGRSNEVAYLVDGVTVTDAFNGGLSVEIENTSIRQMEVITGNFNAEYGQAMSGVVNIVTQDGSSKLEGTVSAYTGNYFTNHTDIFRNLDKLDRLPARNVQVSLSGPTGLKNLTFFLTGRYFENEGHLFGKRVYNIGDNVPFLPNPSEPDFWIPRNTGDGAYVPLNPEKKYSFNGKVTYSLPMFKISYSLFYDDNYNKYYDHYFSWTPDGIRSHYRYNAINSVQLSHFPSQSTFQTLKFSSNLHQYEGYLYEDPFDPRYIDPNQGIATSGYTFRSGGNDGGRYERSTLTYIGQWSINSQISKEHKIGAGIEGRLHDIFNHGYNLINLTEGQQDTLGNPIVTLGYRNPGEEGNESYYKKPYEFAAYVQDKMEYDIMIINAGVRLDYFQPNSNQPVDLRNVTNNPLYPGASQFEKAEAKFQISPRLGASFPITDQGIIRFSYGHFFKIPNFENLYRNSDFLINPTASVSSIMGNPDLKAEKTVQYEIGLQQVLFPNLVLNFAVYYRDIRNLLGMEIINTYEGFKYARFVNRDYGNVRGFTVTLDKRFADYFSAKVDYTFQIAEGNASDPFAVYNNNQTDPPVEDAKAVVPLNWDQRSTLNLSFNVGEPGDWNAGFIFQYGSGWPYTEDPKRSNGVRFENGGIKPSFLNLDLRAEKVFKVGAIDLNVFLLVYNVLDIKNENDVYASTGRANADLNVKEAGAIFGINTFEQYINNPAMYSTPREIRLGFGFGF
ncbi:MAG: TonB-dependent receptor [Ignavibacteriales bacterium]|nr:MAG: TonB-dependent receptor [Ignavibacteriales bacterium]